MSVWLTKRTDISYEILVRNLGASYRPTRKAAGGAGQSARQVDTGMRDKIVVGEDEYFCSSSQAAICPRGQAAISTMCHTATVPSEGLK